VRGQEEETDIDRLVQTVVDSMAISIPSKHFVQPALALAAQGMASADPNMRKAGVALLGVIAEGCCDPLKQCLGDIMPRLLALYQVRPFALPVACRLSAPSPAKTSLFLTYPSPPPVPLRPPLVPRRTLSITSARCVCPPLPRPTPTAAPPPRPAPLHRTAAPHVPPPLTPPHPTSLHLLPHVQVASFALGQFAEHCQPDILHYHSTVLPVVFHALEDVQETVQSTSCYVLEMFLENLSRETLRPFLQPLLTRLMTKLTTVKTRISQEMALTAISSVAVAAEIEFLPFSEVRGGLKMGYRSCGCAG